MSSFDLFGKKKRSAIEFGKNVVMLNGLVSSSFIACFIPSVSAYIHPNDSQQQQQQQSLSSFRMQTNYYILTSFCLGITNLMTYLNSDISSTIQSIKANIFTYFIMISAQIYHNKYYSNAVKPNVHVLSLSLHSILLGLSIYANFKLESAFPNKAIRSLIKIPKQSSLSSSSSPSKSRSSMINDELMMQRRPFDISDNSTLYKSGSQYYAKWYSKGVTHLCLELDDDDLFDKSALSLCVIQSKTAQFKLSQALKSVVIERCEAVSIEIGESVKSIEMLNCKQCTLYIKKKCPLITIENCEEPKLILFNAVIKQRPKIISTNAVNFEIEIQKEAKEESEWKSMMIPYQLKTEIDAMSLKAHTCTVDL